MPREETKSRRHSRDRRSRSAEHKSSRDRHREKDKDRERERERDRDTTRDRERDKEREREWRREKDGHRERSSKKRRSATPPTKSKSPLAMSSVKLLQTLEARRLRDQEERQARKEELKAQETPEEKRARRLQEKQAKEHRRRERMGWDNEYQTYSNDDNPFGDSNLTSTFHWGKKLQVEGLSNLSSKTVEVLSLQKQMENRRELEKVKKRRQERELERQVREDDAMQQQRAKEAVQFREWQRQEDQFHLEQARLRSEIRIRDGRAKPIDLLAQYVAAGNAPLEESLEMQMHEPYMLLHGLPMEELEDLLVDIKVYEELEQGKHIDFWNDMVTIVQDELQKQQKLHADASTLNQRRDGIHQSVVKDVADIFRGKNAKQLEEMRDRIEAKINSRADGVDISYWESLLSQLKAHMARARLRDRHQALLREKLLLLKRENDDEATAAAGGGEDHASALKEEPESEQATDEPMKEAAAAPAQEETSAEEQRSPSQAEDETETDDEEDGPLRELLNAARLYQAGSYSPEYIREDDFTGRRIQAGDRDDNDDGAMYEESDDESRIHRQRMLIVCPERVDAASSGKQQLSAQEQRMRNEARQGMQGDEAEFSVETTLDAVPQLATDKYRPRKPRYFNRVHTGFEWNKYNQTHYDMDNPPPKIVQGYKFNIFYPDLMDKSQTPQYFLTPCADNGDFAVLRFHTGPPYEDIAFKIVNREWEFSYKRGFRCQFHNNIFQLWFHFKRYRYRR
ncbi:cactin [Drosophila obscura]|uniref:cactin n=1 Tax=Drosophila obscura TaxID=7282 RepID=UPI001BB176C3|nr:cactin [Drosophila obscura]